MMPGNIRRVHLLQRYQDAYFKNIYLAMPESDKHVSSTRHCRGGACPSRFLCAKISSKERLQPSLANMCADKQNFSA